MESECFIPELSLDISQSTAHGSGGISGSGEEETKVSTRDWRMMYCPSLSLS